MMIMMRAVVAAAALAPEFDESKYSGEPSYLDQFAHYYNQPHMSRGPPRRGARPFGGAPRLCRPGRRQRSAAGTSTSSPA
ncbi:hypothetical protein ACIA98_40570 [Streptomyces sp. NPDC051366]|uniref:hypothetical protein n=1 Tax=Streptomyces sp. NPDC051366 TaxID=3365652 RepID=UPI0037ADCF11